jgi:hypothetical protein
VRGYHDQIVGKLVEFFDLHSSNPTFQELAIPSFTVIKEWVQKHSAKCGGGL